MTKLHMLQELPPVSGCIMTVHVTPRIANADNDRLCLTYALATLEATRDTHAHAGLEGPSSPCLNTHQKSHVRTSEKTE